MQIPKHDLGDRLWPTFYPEISAVNRTARRLMWRVREVEHVGMIFEWSFKWIPHK
jgi:hypothetical protein